MLKTQYPTFESFAVVNRRKQGNAANTNALNAENQKCLYKTAECQWAINRESVLTGMNINLGGFLVLILFIPLRVFLVLVLVISTRIFGVDMYTSTPDGHV